MATEPEVIAVHTEQITVLKENTDDQWSHINKIEDALTKLVPIWTTVVLMTMSALTASALTFAGMLIKFSGG